jgi:hypothetical protein
MQNLEKTKKMPKKKKKKKKNLSDFPEVQWLGDKNMELIVRKEKP